MRAALATVSRSRTALAKCGRIFPIWLREAFIMTSFRMLICTLFLTLVGTSGTHASWLWFSDMLAERQIERLIEDALDRNVVQPHSLTILENAVILDVDLIRRQKWTPEQKVVVVELEVDFGPAPPGVIGFERLRRDTYWLVLETVDGALAIKRFAPMLKVEPRSAGF